ncbi:MAG: PaaI family thioesterase [Gammaproteobacteria bacterium]
MSIVERMREARASGDFSGLVAAIPYMASLGLEPVMVDGRLQVRLEASRIHVGNPFLQALHGGMLGGLLESTAILELALELAGDALPKPITITVDYLRSGRVAPTFADARVTRLGRRVANVHARCWQDDPDRPTATLIGHFLVG